MRTIRGDRFEIVLRWTGHFVTVIMAMTLAASCWAAEGPGAATGQTHFVVTDYGASGKDDQKDTNAFQKAVDACSAAGGGIVDVPPGSYTLGRVLLKDNVTLNLSAGAVLRPSLDRGDYPTITGAPDSNYQASQGENALNCRFALLYAYKAKNVTLTGRGKLFGDGKAFWTVKNKTDDFPRWNTTIPWHYYSPKPFRPVMVLFEDCEHVAVHDVTVEDSPCYSGWFAGCRYVQISHVAVLNDLAGPNSDGFHFSSCRNVHVTDCNLVCGDDCIAIDPNHRGPSSNFVIANCVFKTTVNAFRIYTGLDPLLPATMARGQVSDISASNCSVEDASGVFNITAERGDIARLVFSNFSINMDSRGSALFFQTIAGGGIRDVMLSNMAIRTDGAGTISGEDGGKISNITLDGIRYELYPRTKMFGNGMPDPLPSYCFHHFAPYNLYVRHAQDVRLRNIQMNWRETDLADLDKVAGGKPSWSAVECQDVRGLDVEGVTCSPFGKDSPAIQLTDVNHARISHCQAQPGTGVFLQVAGQSEEIGLSDNDLAEATKAYGIGGNLSPTTVYESGNHFRPEQ